MKFNKNILELSSPEYTAHREYLNQYSIGLDLHKVKYGGSVIVYFVNAEDALHFKLKFGDYFDDNDH